MVLSVDIANRAIMMIGNNQALIGGAGNYPTETWVTTLPTGSIDPAAIAASVLYNDVVNTIGRQFGWDFSRNQVALSAGNTSGLPVQWKFEYLYPGNGIQIRQLVPTTIVDPNNPLPIRWTVGNDLILGVATKVILTNLAAGFAVYSNQVNENLWDAGFTEAVVRLLASTFAMALAGRPDTAQHGLEAFQAFEGAGEIRTDA